MTKLLLFLVIVVVFFLSLLPLSGVALRQGFRHPGRSWSASAVYFGARLRMRIGRYATAQRIIERALLTWPEHPKVPEATYWVGFCCEKTGKPLEALDWYRRFLLRWPSHVWALQAQRRVSILEAEDL